MVSDLTFFFFYTDVKSSFKHLAIKLLTFPVVSAARVELKKKKTVYTFIVLDAG